VARIVQGISAVSEDCAELQKPVKRYVLRRCNQRSDSHRVIPCAERASSRWSLHQDNIELLLVVGALHLQRHRLTDEVREHCEGL
jgi:hypothetical protein